MAAYRIIRTPDARSRGAVSFFDVESVTADGRRSWIATVDTRDEARDLIRRLEAGNQAARDAATAAELAAARDQASRVRNCRKGAHGRNLAAARLRAARAAYLAADEAADLAR
jgi:hypothetical protein